MFKKLLAGIIVIAGSVFSTGALTGSLIFILDEPEMPESML